MSFIPASNLQAWRAGFCKNARDISASFEDGAMMRDAGLNWCPDAGSYVAPFDG
jgi:hypothetical protein